VLDVPVVFMKESKGAPVGNALAAGVGVGVFKDYSLAKSWAKTTDHHQPDPQLHEHYMKLYEIYRHVYEDVKGNFEPLARATGYL
jgi:xylulokinase